MPGSAYENVGEWGVPGLRADRTQRGHGAGDARNPSMGEPAGGQWGKVVQRSGRSSGTHRAETRDDGVGVAPNAVVNGAPGRLGRPTPGRAAQSSTLRQRLPETPRSRSGYPLRLVAGCRPRGLGVRHSRHYPCSEAAGRHGTCESRRPTVGNPSSRASVS